MYSHMNLTPVSHDYSTLSHTDPIVAPIFSASRSENGTAIIISWQPITLEQARGFFLYRVTLTPAIRNKRQAVITRNVPHTQTSVAVSILDPGVEYAVSVGVVNVNNMDMIGPTRAPLTVTPPTTG